MSPGWGATQTCLALHGEQQQCVEAAFTAESVASECRWQLKEALQADHAELYADSFDEWLKTSAPVLKLSVDVRRSLMEICRHPRCWLSKTLISNTLIILRSSCEWRIDLHDGAGCL